MEWVDAFDSWGAYRSFVEETQQSLYEELRGAYEAGDDAFEASDGRLIPGFGTGDDSVVAEPPYRWQEPVYGKYRGPERQIFSDDSVRFQFYATTKDRGGGKYVEKWFFGSDYETLIEEGETRESLRIYPPIDDDRHEAYVWEAPWWVQGCEFLLDTVTAMLVLFDRVGPEARGDVYDRYSDLDYGNCIAARMAAKWLVEPYDREVVVDGAILSDVLDRIGRQYDRLAPLTVWGTAEDTDLAAVDDSLREGQARPRSWRVEPHEALSGLEWTISEGEGTAVVTVDRQHEVITPAFQRVTPFRRGTVEGCDEGFPAEPGEEVVLAPANVIEEVDIGASYGPTGRTDHQQAVLAAVEADPTGLSDEQIDLLVTLVTTAEPAPRQRAVEGLGRIAIEGDADDRPVEALIDGVSDGETAIATAALDALATVASADPTPVVDGLDTVVTALDSEDDDVLVAAGAVLSAVAKAEASALVPYTERLTDALAAHEHRISDDDGSAFGGLLDALAAVDAAGGDVVERVPGVVVSLAGSLDDDVAAPARAILDRVDPESDAEAAVATGVEDRLLDKNVWEMQRSLAAGAVGMTHPDVVDGATDRMASSLSRWAEYMLVPQVGSIAWGLGMLGTTAPERVPEEAVATLREVSDASDDAIADPALIALAAIGDPILEPGTVAAITGTSADRPKRRRVSVAAAREVGTARPELFADNSGVTWLARKACEDGDERVRSAARDALAAIAESNPDAFETAAAAVSARDPDLTEQIAADESLPPAVRTAFADD